MEEGLRTSTSITNLQKKCLNAVFLKRRLLQVSIVGVQIILKPVFCWKISLVLKNVLKHIVFKIKKLQTLHLEKLIFSMKGANNSRVQHKFLFSKVQCRYTFTTFNYVKKNNVHYTLCVLQLKVQQHTLECTMLGREFVMKGPV